MERSQLNQPQSDEMLSELAQERLHNRISEADGNVDNVRNQILAQLETLDHEIENDGQEDRVPQQAERAFLVAQLAYLTALEQSSDEEESKSGWFSKLWSRGTQKQAA